MCPHGVSVPIELEVTANDDDDCEEQCKSQPSLKSIGQVLGNFRRDFGKGLRAKLKGEKPSQAAHYPPYIRCVQ